MIRFARVQQKHTQQLNTFLIMGRNL